MTLESLGHCSGQHTYIYLRYHGRTLFGTLPTRHQQGDLNYFQPIPGKVQELLDIAPAEMLKIGCPMAVKHNEVGTRNDGHKAGYLATEDLGDAHPPAIPRHLKTIDSQSIFHF